jgi:2-iminobutanoate/2-iminopropanoate deaminase
MATRSIETPDAPAAIGPYSQAVVANGFLFTAGQIALDPATGHVVEGGIVAQAERVMRSLGALLTAAGTDWSNVVKTTVYLQSMADFAAVNEVYARAVGAARPARSTVEVAKLPRGVLVEIEAVAALARG